MIPSEHIDHLIQDLIDGSLDAATSARAEAHLNACDRCREEWAAFQRLAGALRALPRSIEPQRELWGGIAERLGDGGRDVDRRSMIVDRGLPDRERAVSGVDGRSPDRLRGSKGANRDTDRGATERSARRGRRSWYAVGLMAAMVAAAGAIVWILGVGSDGGWGVNVLGGMPRIAEQAVDGESILRPGEWLETDAASRARIAVGSIGEVEVDPNSRVQLRRARLSDHRLGLAEGRIEARIWAPPRLFFVETPSATAIDLGCAYTLDVDSTGRSTLHVTSGYVELVRGDRASVVPAGAMCYASPATGPGTVFSENASPALRTALERFDFAGAGASDLEIILEEAREQDAITLWQLVEQTDGARRGRIYEKLVDLVRPPKGVTPEGIARGDKEMFVMWRLQLSLEAISWWGYFREKISFPNGPE